jgi:hypothetical protein
MSMKKLSGLMLAGAAAAGLVLTASVAEAGGNKVRERCKVKADDLGKLDARWEIKKVGSSKERRRFRAQFEADDASGLLEGALIDVYVSTTDTTVDPPVESMVLVGQMTLKLDDDQDDDGDKDLEGKLRFDSKPHSSSSHPWQPFPAVWPADVGEGTTVEVRNGATPLLACDL